MSTIVATAIMEMRDRLCAQEASYGHLSVRRIRNDISSTLDDETEAKLSAQLYAASAALWPCHVGIAPPAFAAAVELLDEAERQAEGRP